MTIIIKMQEKDPAPGGGGGGKKGCLHGWSNQIKKHKCTESGEVRFNAGTCRRPAEASRGASPRLPSRLSRSLLCL